MSVLDDYARKLLECLPKAVRDSRVPEDVVDSYRNLLNEADNVSDINLKAAIYERIALSYKAWDIPIGLNEFEALLKEPTQGWDFFDVCFSAAEKLCALEPTERVYLALEKVALQGSCIPKETGRNRDDMQLMAIRHIYTLALDLDERAAWALYRIGWYFSFDLEYDGNEKRYENAQWGLLDVGEKKGLLHIKNLENRLKMLSTLRANAIGDYKKRIFEKQIMASFDEVVREKDVCKKEKYFCYMLRSLRSVEREKVIEEYFALENEILALPLETIATYYARCLNRVKENTRAAQYKDKIIKKVKKFLKDNEEGLKKIKKYELLKDLLLELETGH